MILIMRGDTASLFSFNLAQEAHLWLIATLPWPLSSGSFT